MVFPDTRSRSIHQAMMNCHPDAVNAMPRTFTTIKAVRFYADVIIKRLMNFRIFYAEYHRDTMASAARLESPCCADLADEIDRGLAQHIGNLERWQKAFAPLMKSTAEGMES
jgi:hypothetical protein